MVIRPSFTLAAHAASSLVGITLFIAALDITFMAAEDWTLSAALDSTFIAAVDLTQSREKCLSWRFPTRISSPMM